jgi:hypothetical protein
MVLNDRVQRQKACSEETAVPYSKPECTFKIRAAIVCKAILILYTYGCKLDYGSPVLKYNRLTWCAFKTKRGKTEIKRRQPSGPLMARRKINFSAKGSGKTHFIFKIAIAASRLLIFHSAEPYAFLQVFEQKRPECIRPSI